MTIPGRGKKKVLWTLPASVGGWIALGLCGLSVVLLLPALVLRSAFPVPLFYPIIALVACGFIAVLAVALQHERSIAVFATLLAGVLAGAFLLAMTHGGSATNPSVTLGEGDNGRTVTVSVHTSILLQLPANPSTGYDWEVTIQDPSVLGRGTTKFTPSSSAPGAGGTYNFWFQPKTSGRTDLTLVYRRSWETGVPPLKTYGITIVVQ